MDHVPQLGAAPLILTITRAAFLLYLKMQLFKNTIHFAGGTRGGGEKTERRHRILQWEGHCTLRLKR